MFGVTGLKFSKVLHGVGGSSTLLMHAFEGNIPIRCGMPVQTMKVLSVNVCYLAPKLIRYYGNIP